jgi:protein-tyrosine kinase
MTRVNDALARARAAGTDFPAAAEQETPGGPGLMPADVAPQLWPAETPPGSPATQAAARFDSREEQPALDLSSTEARTGSDSAMAPKLILNDGIERASVEQYRRLAARLHIAQAERGTHVVMVTSALAGEGKTLTATNLALTLSESYKKRVLLIDADLRHPGVHDILRVPNVAGLNDGMPADETRKVPLIRLTERLSVLTAGRPEPDPMSVLSSERMRRVLKDASVAFEWVIIDTPPVGLLSDAHLLATLVDTVVFVVHAGVTPCQAIRKATEAVGRDRIIGVVLNRAKAVASAESYEYYRAGVQDSVQGTS